MCLASCRVWPNGKQSFSLRTSAWALSVPARRWRTIGRSGLPRATRSEHSRSPQAGFPWFCPFWFNGPSYNSIGFALPNHPTHLHSAPALHSFSKPRVACLAPFSQSAFA
ncbi:uncharacterized protein BKA78DRAFT_179220 [Phyllosticta capitalensis]|uniref:uncharacterized protein n=1 Tax=Phyllosticta capitalensis TaxID=121624 RepID=UPI00312E92B4